MDHFSEIRERLDEYGLDAMLLTSYNNRLYASGIRCSFGAVLVTKKDALYFTDARFAETAGDALGREHVCVVTASTLFSEAARRLKDGGVQKLGIEDEYLTYRQLQNLRAASDVELCPAQQLIALLRAVKSPDDIKALIEAQEMTEEAYSQVLQLIRPGISERDIAAELISRMIRLGARKTSFDPIIVAGKRGCLPHGAPTDNKICRGDFVTMDFGFVVNGWCSDMTRTVAVGSVTDEMSVIYHTVLRAQEAGINAAKPGVAGKEIDAAGRKVIEDAGFGQYFCHGFGHGLGIEGHEWPGASSSDTTPLPVGAVISAEPGIYIPGRLGVRIEDIIYLTEHGAVDITHASKELTIL